MRLSFGRMELVLPGLGENTMREVAIEVVGDPELMTHLTTSHR